MNDNFSDFGATAPTIPSTAPVADPQPPRSPLVFQTSEKTDKLVGALAKAQGEIESAEKDRTNPHFGQGYATLAAVWSACRGPLSKNGVVVIQWPIPASAPNRVALITRVAHEDQWMQSGLEMPTVRSTAQDVGSALTYLRRYMLSAVAGVAPADDDDGNDASGRNQQQQKPPRQQQQAPGKPAATAEPEQPEAPKPPTQAQLARLFAIADEYGWTKDQLKGYMSARWGIESTKDLSRGQYDALVAVIQQQNYQQACAGILTAPRV